MASSFSRKCRCNLTLDDAWRGNLQKYLFDNVMDDVLLGGMLNEKLRLNFNSFFKFMKL